jgi:hypothetical protein
MTRTTTPLSLNPPSRAQVVEQSTTMARSGGPRKPTSGKALTEALLQNILDSEFEILHGHA